MEGARGTAGRSMVRRRFLGTLTALGVPLPLAAWVRSGAPMLDDEATPSVPGPDALSALGDGGAGRAAAVDYPRNDLERVQAVVGASHGNFERVRTLVEEQPALAKASWDWGFGDWESALGAASHTGRREIADFLVSHGARPTVFSAAMLGELATVEAFLTSDPTLYHLNGPHGISLMRHARSGGAEAQSVVDFLLDRFGPDDRPFGFPGDDAVAARYAGRYRFDEAPPFELAVGVRNDWLMVGAGEQPNARVLEVEPDVFHPTGAPGVRLRFDVRDGRAARLTIEDGPMLSTGRRID